jgi:hypothetical protein
LTPAHSADLRTRKLTHSPERLAEVLLSATTGGQGICHLYGVDDPCADLPVDERIGTRVNMKRPPEAVELIAAKWNT